MALGDGVASDEASDQLDVKVNAAALAIKVLERVVLSQPDFTDGSGLLTKCLSDAARSVVADAVGATAGEDYDNTITAVLAEIPAGWLSRGVRSRI
jgi:hypothetical protein